MTLGRTFAAGLCVVATCASAALPAGAQAASGIAFDQVDRALPVDAQPPAPGPFKDDYNLAIKAADDLARVPGLMSGGPAGFGISLLSGLPGFGGLAVARAAQALNAAASARINEIMAEQAHAGTTMRYAFYRGWSRIEYRGMFAMIVRPDRREALFVDLRAKTFRRFPYNGTPQMPVPANNGTLHSTVVSAPTPPLALDGIEREGVQTDYRLQLAGTRPCTDVTLEIHETAYFADVALPELLAGENDALEPLALPLGCSPTIVHDAATPPAPPRVYVYRVIRVAGGLNVAGMRPMMLTTVGATHIGTGMSGTFVSERGNFTTLGPADEPLFDVPAGYAETK